VTEGRDNARAALTWTYIGIGKGTTPVVRQGMAPSAPRECLLAMPSAEAPVRRALSHHAEAGSIASGLPQAEPVGCRRGRGHGGGRRPMCPRSRAWAALIRLDKTVLIADKGPDGSSCGSANPHACRGRGAQHVDAASLSSRKTKNWPLFNTDSRSGCSWLVSFTLPHRMSGDRPARVGARYPPMVKPVSIIFHEPRSSISAHAAS